MTVYSFVAPEMPLNLIDRHHVFGSLYIFNLIRYFGAHHLVWHLDLTLASCHV